MAVSCYLDPSIRLYSKVGQKIVKHGISLKSDGMIVARDHIYDLCISYNIYNIHSLYNITFSSLSHWCNVLIKQYKAEFVVARCSVLNFVP
jgi:hypothetical protein